MCHVFSKQRDRQSPAPRLAARCMQLVFASVLLLAGGAVHAEALVVIVNPASGVQQMTRTEVAEVYMARHRTLPSGVRALPLDIRSDAAEREQFYALLIGKTLAQVNTYWARLLFTGHATPPQQLDSPVDIVSTVAENKGAIGYVPKSKVDSKVRIVLELAP